MNATGRRLAEVQLDGHRQVDKLYGPLSLAIAEVVVRYATPDQHGILRLSLPARALILAEVGRLLDETRGKLLPVVLASVQAARDAAQEGVEPVPVPLTEQMDEMLLVSRALRTDRETVLGQTDKLLLVGIAAKMAATQVANRVRQYFSPFFATYRDVNGKVLHKDRMGAVQHWPGRAGMASAHSRTVLLTETTRAHSLTMLRLAERDGLLIRYTLSPKHRDADACSDNARRDNGWGPGIYRADDAPRVPVHPRCFPAGVEVSGPEAIASTERWYEGDLVEISTAGGLQLPVTPNHPILTTKGWVAAGLLHEGDDVVCHGLSQRVTNQVHPDEQKIPTLIEDVARSLRGTLAMMTVSVPTTSVDFHGDGIDGEVCVIRTDGFLSRGFYAAVLQPPLHEEFASTGMGLSLLSGHSGLTPLLKAVGFPALGSVSSLRVGEILFGTSQANHQPIGLSDVSQRNAVIDQTTANCASANTKGDGDAIFRLSGYVTGADVQRKVGGARPDATANNSSALADDATTRNLVTHAFVTDARTLAAGGDIDSRFVETDRIIQVERRQFVGHVYNLETKEGWYRANGIVVHNCRCYYSPAGRAA